VFSPPGSAGDPLRGTDVREFQSRTAAGVRAPASGRRRGDLAVDPQGLPSDTEERDDYLGHALWRERAKMRLLPPPREMSTSVRAVPRAEEFILTVCANGYGKRSSAYEYRRIGRGGQGITNIGNLDRNGPVVASFPRHNGEQLMLSRTRRS
jgi:DNA gyrase subunit A